MEFESIGENCEFGLVQRYFGVEPISLFRWVSISMESLADVIENGLDGIGSPTQTILGVSDANEYFVSDTRYRFGMHTFVQKESISEDRLLDQQCRRLRFLTRQFKQGLSTGEKMFVFAQAQHVDADLLTRFQTALQRWPAARVLLVRRCDERRSVGNVECIGRGLSAGYIGRFGKLPSGAWDIAYEDWLMTCRAAIRVEQESAVGRS